EFLSVTVPNSREDRRDAQAEKIPDDNRGKRNDEQQESWERQIPHQGDLCQQQRHAKAKEKGRIDTINHDHASFAKSPHRPLVLTWPSRNKQDAPTKIPSQSRGPGDRSL